MELKIILYKDNIYSFIIMNIYLIDGKIYYKETKNDNYTLIKTSNWTSFLKEWNLFSKDWKNILDLEKFGLKNNNGNGDCLFLSISSGLNTYNKLNKIKYRYNNSILRKMLSDEIDENNFDEILNYYKQEYLNNEFIGDWNPNKITSINKFKNIIKSNKFLGDYLTISLFEKILKLNFIILNSENNNIYNLGNDINKYEKTIILYYENMCHFKLVGYYNNNKIYTLFDKNTIPTKIINLYKNI
jgi:hypothetical protein